MVTARDQQSASPSPRDPWRSRWVPLTSLVLVALGILTLLASRQAPPVETPTAEQSAWHLATHPTGAGPLPGLALHPGPEIATLAASLGPAGSPATILAVASSPVAGAPAVAATPATAETVRTP